MSIKFLVLGGGVFGVFGGGGRSADFIFMGAGIFLSLEAAILRPCVFGRAVVSRQKVGHGSVVYRTAKFQALNFTCQGLKFPVKSLVFLVGISAPKKNLAPPPPQLPCKHPPSPSPPRPNPPGRPPPLGSSIKNRIPPPPADSDSPFPSPSRKNKKYPKRPPSFAC